MSDCLPCESCFKDGMTTENERIIKLLESRKQHPALAAIDNSAKVMNNHIDLTIALIKGEN